MNLRTLLLLGLGLAPIAFGSWASCVEAYFPAVSPKPAAAVLAVPGPELHSMLLALADDEPASQPLPEPTTVPAEPPTLEITVNGEVASGKVISVARDSLVKIATECGGGPVREADRKLSIAGVDDGNLAIAPDRKSAIFVSPPGTHEVEAVVVGEQIGYVRCVATVVIKDPQPVAAAAPPQVDNDPRLEVGRLYAQVNSENKRIEAAEVARAYAMSDAHPDAISYSKSFLAGMGANDKLWQGFHNGVAAMLERMRAEGQLRDTEEYTAAQMEAKAMDEVAIVLESVSRSASP